MVMWNNSQWLLNILQNTGKRETPGNIRMGKCTGQHVIHEIMLKMALTAMQNYQFIRGLLSHSHTLTPFDAPGKQAF